MQERDRILEEVFQHCDLRERMALVPPSAQVRGLYFRSIEEVLSRAELGRRYRALFPDRIAAVRWYPVCEFMVRLAVGASLLTSPDRVQEGMFEIGRRNAIAFADSLLGRTVLRLLSRDPKKLLLQGVAARRQSCNFGSWELNFPAERRAVMSMREEYLYIDSYMLGAAQGTFDAINLPVRLELELEDRFNGRHLFEW